jgi:hypothetical protein
MTLLWIVFWVLAVFFNAVMDATENENFHESIFKNLPKGFWYKRESWKHTPKILGWRADAWHISKSLMVVCMVASVVLYHPLINKLVDFLLMGVLWNVAFNLFYHKLFKVK